jgi:hypothetical protein
MDAISSLQTASARSVINLRAGNGEHCGGLRDQSGTGGDGEGEQAGP